MKIYGDSYQRKEPNPIEPVEIENGVKISFPIITNQELETLDYQIATDYHNIINEISKTVARDKDIIILKRIIKYQDNEIKELKRRLGENEDV